MTKIAWIGTGVMGTPMAGHLANAGHELHLFNRTPAKAQAAMTEALHYAMSVGLDPEKMLAVITKGAAGSWQLENMAPRVLAKDFAPAFFIKHFLKDLKIIEEEMATRDTSLATVHTVRQMYEEMAALGYENDGTQALIKLYQREES